MSVPISQMISVVQYVLKNKKQKKEKYPLVLMLEPLFRCNLSCSGCGKIQYPPDVLRQQLSVDQCLDAALQCDAPVVSIAGGEPLLHPDMPQIIEGLIQQKRHIYMCTNAILLEEKLSLFKPSQYLSISVHLDGLKEEHTKIVEREGVYDKAISAIQAAVKAGFRVTTNTTLFNTANPERTRQFFDTVMDLGVEGMMISPGYNYSRANDQEHFLRRKQTINLFRKILYKGNKRWMFNQSPLFLEFLVGKHEDYECTPWGTITYNQFGWQSPCYLLDKEHYATYQELLEKTDWSKYGRKSGNPDCQDCMMHCGYEPTTVHHTFYTRKGFLDTVKATIFKINIPAPVEDVNAL
ncbi:MAG: adenosyl-hopene transferase HpnH [Planctomycetes bacterium]|jgi:hopanoid biosynthesis associated radical SAM protein HpnH|nr:adenosyl-hopene transferase HpnH [Planctomycetota bacterium]HPY74340.1 adenosyl-hopene transferase HpnH [Planctomycetota bacterium]HQA99894.1 adenosyl-hopene transferase HpnH [Planctomycetota bacterium]